MYPVIRIARSINSIFRYSLLFCKSFIICEGSSVTFFLRGRACITHYYMRIRSFCRVGGSSISALGLETHAIKQGLPTEARND